MPYSFPELGRPIVGQDAILRGACRSAATDHAKKGRFGESAAGCQLALANPPHSQQAPIRKNYIALGSRIPLPPGRGSETVVEQRAQAIGFSPNLGPIT
jgi:hypothetical protein